MRWRSAGEGAGAATGARGARRRRRRRTHRRRRGAPGAPRRRDPAAGAGPDAAPNHPGRARRKLRPTARPRWRLRRDPTSSLIPSGSLRAARGRRSHTRRDLYRETRGFLTVGARSAFCPGPRGAPGGKHRDNRPPEGSAFVLAGAAPNVSCRARRAQRDHESSAQRDHETLQGVPRGPRRDGPAPREGAPGPASPASRSWAPTTRVPKRRRRPECRASRARPRRSAAPRSSSWRRPSRPTPPSSPGGSRPGGMCSSRNRCAPRPARRGPPSAAARFGARLFVGHSERFNPVVRTLARLVRDETVLSIDLRRVGPSRPCVSGVLVNLGVHDFDLAAYLGGGELTLRGAVGLGGGFRAGATTPTGEPDAAHVLFSTAGGATGHLYVDRAAPTRERANRAHHGPLGVPRRPAGAPPRAHGPLGRRPRRRAAAPRRAARGAGRRPRRRARRREWRARSPSATTACAPWIWPRARSCSASRRPFPKTLRSTPAAARARSKCPAVRTGSVPSDAARGKRALLARGCAAPDPRLRGRLQVLRARRARPAGDEPRHRARRVRLRHRPERLGQVDAAAPALPRRDGRRRAHPLSRARRRAPSRRRGAVSAPQPGHRVPGLQARAVVERLRERRRHPRGARPARAPDSRARRRSARARGAGRARRHAGRRPVRRRAAAGGRSRAPSSASRRSSWPTSRRATSIRSSRSTSSVSSKRSTRAGRRSLFATHDRTLLEVRPRRIVVLDDGKAIDVPHGHRLGDEYDNRLPL